MKPTSAIAPALIALMLIAATTPAFSQNRMRWEWRNPMPQGNELFDVVVGDADNATAVGDFGMILNTTDGGTTWTILPHNIPWDEKLDNTAWRKRRLRHIYHRSDGTGTILGDYGTYYVTTASGAPWKLRHISTDSDINDYHVNGQTVIAVGTRIFRSADGGASWFVRLTGFGFGELYSVGYAGDGVWIAAGWQGEALRSTDDGLTWQRLDFELPINFHSAWFRDDGTGFLGSYYRTTDRGATWTEGGNTVNVEILGHAFLDDETGVVFGDKGMIYRTTDGGASWSSVASPATDWLNAAKVVQSDIIIVGNDGTILRSSDRGVTWQQVASTTKEDLFAVSFDGDRSGMAVGRYGTIVRTTDGGMTWKDVAPGARAELAAVGFVNERVGFTAGGQGTVLRTTDGGTTWTRLQTGISSDLKAIAFHDSARGYVARGPDVFRTTDGGVSWTERRIARFETTITDIAIVDDTTAVAVGMNPSGFISRTTDGGTTWTEYDITTDQNFHSVSFHGQFGLIGGTHATVARTFDGGATWTVSSGVVGVDAYDVLAVDVVDEVTAFATGQHGHLYRTRNQGANWVDQPRPQGDASFDLYSVDFVDTLNGIAVGVQGATFHTTNGGKKWSLLESGTWNRLRGVAHVAGDRWIVVGSGGRILASTTSAPTLTVHDGNTTGRTGSSPLTRVSPNPSSDIMAFTFSLPSAAHTRLTVSNTIGEEIATLAAENLPAGMQRVEWNTAGLPDGVYLYRLEVRPAGSTAMPTIKTGTIVVSH